MSNYERVIQVNTELPKSLDGNTIYVTVSEDGKDFGAKSSEPFGYKNFTGGRGCDFPRIEAQQITNWIFDNFWFQVPPEECLKALQEENDTTTIYTNQGLEEKLSKSRFLNV
ncbi:hypothetical protein CMI38_06765 [Candidatus Pacearchaeota archaeon]|jgi:hypothetical protein|nr:hypothetical protein [Candidatus Pacearchaeota archaeon]|tara:strand:+ start:270 stop:605 length:336 start_codon:yes stop_codon:yes gene_type:complete